MVGLTSQQRMLTPPRHLTPPLHLSWVRVVLLDLLCLLDYDYVRYIVNFTILNVYQNCQTQTTRIPGGGIRCLGGGSIPCLPVIPTMNDFFITNTALSASMTNYHERPNHLYKNVRQHLTQRKFLIINQIIVTAIEFTKSWHQTIMQTSM
jgi:hypothetical protein